MRAGRFRGLLVPYLRVIVPALVMVLGFVAVVELAWDEDTRRQHVERGLELGAYVFDRLYRDLFALSL